MELLSAGRFDEAAVVFRASIEARPGHAPTLNNLGVALRAAGRRDEALEIFREAVSSDPGHAPSLANLAKTLHGAGLHGEAAETAMRAIGLRPADAGSLTILGASLVELGRHGLAVPHLRRALDLSGGKAEIRGSLAKALDGAGEPDEALAQARAAFRDAPDNLACVLLLQRLEAQEAELSLARERAEAEARERPDDPSLGFMRRVLGREGGDDRAPAEYVEQLFDGYAERFDDHLLGPLRYEAHRHVAEAAVASLGGRRARRTLDLGCGTGLCGALLRAHTDLLEGVDLSEGMLARAREAGDYDDLHREDILAFLEREAPPWDIVTAADVLVYFGDLTPVFREVRRRIAPDGLFAFTLERQDAAGFRLTDHGRFKHGADHLAASTEGLFRTETKEVVLRMERGGPVRGLLCALRPAG